jgi:predicted neutral ceramidase superfamily lipid hydrolase
MSDNATQKLLDRIHKLEEIITLSAHTCGQHNCNCPGSNKIKTLVKAYLASYPEFANTLPVRQTRGNR